MLFRPSSVLALSISSLTAVASAQAPRSADSSASVPTHANATSSAQTPRSADSSASVPTNANATSSAQTPRSGDSSASVLTHANATSSATVQSKSEASSQTASASPKGDGGVRRDPKGKRGISPFWEAIRRGDEAAKLRDFVKAEEAYQAAIGIESKNPIAHARLGQILVRASKLVQAEAAYQEALRLSDRNATLRAAALFVLADLKERQGQRDEAITAWKAYADYLKQDPNAKGYPETPAERESRIRKYQTLASESKAVRERIELRVKEVDEANRRKAAQNPSANK